MAQSNEPPSTVELIRKTVDEMRQFMVLAAPGDLPRADETLASLQAWLAEHDPDYQPEPALLPEAPSGPRWFYFHDSRRTCTHRIVAVRADRVKAAEDKLDGGPFFTVATWDDGEYTEAWSECSDEELDEQGVELLPDAMDEGFIMRHGDDAAEALDAFEAQAGKDE